MKPKYSNILALDYISSNLIIMSISLFVISGYTLIFENEDFISYLFLYIGIIILIVVYLKIIFFANYIMTISNNRAIANIVDFSKYKRVYYIHLNFLINDKEFNRRITVKKTNKLKELLNNKKEIKIIFDPKNTKKIFLAEILFKD